MKVSFVAITSCIVELDHVYLAHALNKPCSSTGRKYALNKQYVFNNQSLRYVYEFAHILKLVIVSPWHIDIGC